jgi:diguanylate cyclase (GGDEF)-like protein
VSERRERAGLGRVGRVGGRIKVLSFVVTAALAPALLVGAASYLAGEATLLEKTNEQLASRTRTVVHAVESWLGERQQDLGIFASSFVITVALSRRTSGGSISASASARIRAYLEQVQERYPLYQTLVVVDTAGHEVARAGAAELSAEAGEASIAWSEAGAAEPLLRLRQPIRGAGDTQLGSLLAAVRLATLWHRLAPEIATNASGLGLASPSARATFGKGSVPTWERARFPGFDRCLSGAPAVARYRAHDGVDVLASCRAVPGADLVVLQEIEADTALAPVRQLRNRVLLIALGGALLMAGFAWALVVRLIRPIEALVAGARAVSAGEYSHEVKVSSADELGYLASVFNEMTRALRASHGELEMMTRTDQLTGVYNRRHLDVALEAELARARREEAPLGVLMMDLDHFKAFNDRFGHLEGDAQLRAVADLLRAQLRPTDTVARYGGEEFTVLLPGSPREESVRIAERLRQQLRELRGGSAQVATTGSFGLATWPDDGETANELIGAADAALYEAKRSGRDRVVVARGVPHGRG